MMMNPSSNRRLNRVSSRHRRRGTVLVVVLGILVVLALIAIAFGAIVSAEYESSLNSLTRFRALSAAKDGEAFAIGNLRAIAANQHYEPEGSWSFNTSFANPDARNRQGPGDKSEDYRAYLQRYAKNPRLTGESNDIIVSFSRGRATNTKGQKDDNWVDLNGDGQIDDSEKLLAMDIINSDPQRLRNVSYFVGDGVDLNIKRGSATAGTARELGDRARLKVIDTNSQFPLNGFTGEELAYRLQVLGVEIAKLVSPPVNPFPEDIAEDIARFKEESLGRIGTKDALLPFLLRTNASAETIEFTLDMVSVRSWPDDDGGVSGTVPYFGPSRFPNTQAPMDPTRRKTFDESQNDPNKRRQTHQENLGAGDQTVRGRDGFPHIEPSGSRERRPPININTVHLPVLVAMLAGIEAEPRFLYYPKSENVLREDAWLQTLNFIEGRRLDDEFSTTDAGRQVKYDSNRDRMIFSDASLPNSANYQIITVGPLAHTVKPKWKELGGGSSEATNPWFEGHHAANIAERIIKDREMNGPYKSWMDFDYRVCHGILLGFQNNTEGMKNSADLVRTNRNSISSNANISAMPKGSGTGENHLLPDPTNLKHPLVSSSDNSAHSYTPAEFDAWYWRACVDMIRCNFNPNGYYNKHNPDAAAYTVVDSTDMRVQSNPLCFSTMGTYEIVSQGEITARRAARVTTGGGQSSKFRLDYPISRRTFRSVVEVYRTFEHTTQADFTKSFDRRAFDRSGGTSAPGNRVEQIETPVSLSAYGTQTYPHSIDLGAYSIADKYTGNRTGQPTGLTGRGGSPTGAAAGGGEPLHGGYYSHATADSRFGYVGLYPQDRSPNRATESNPDGLNFWANYNVSLESRRVASSAGIGNQHIEGHIPYSVARGKGRGGDFFMSRAWNSAYPDPNRQDWKEQGWVGFEAAARRGNADAARHANLRPDGVRLSSWSYNPAFSEDAGSGINPEWTFDAQDRISSRLTALIYRCGQNSFLDTPFAPIAGLNPSPSDENLPGAECFIIPPPDQASDYPITPGIIRMSGADPTTFPSTRIGGRQGTDRQNIMLQSQRQMRTNFPYYEGWVDFWIKWELPPQGKAGAVSQAGEIDPGSGNFSGLIGSTSYGRFEATLNSGSSAANGEGVDRNNLSANNDFEGAQFFIFKEPRGVIRATQIYFNRAYTLRQSDWVHSLGAIGAMASGTPTMIGSNARLWGRRDNEGGTDAGDIQTAPDEFFCTNDIASGSGANNNGVADLGFSFSRTESYFDLNSSENADLNIITHHWYRFSLKYRSNSRQDGSPDTNNPAFVGTSDPHELYIDGRKVTRAGPDLPTPASLSGGALGATARGINDGMITDENGVGTDLNLNPDVATNFMVHRSAALLGEIDPGDKLTIGCVYRQSVSENRSVSGTNASTRLFRFEENMVAPANATLDDVRIYRELRGASGFNGTISESEYAPFSRYHMVGGPSASNETHLRGMYENGFVALQNSGGRTTEYTFPIRVGSLMWTESRPVWDPYRKERLDVNAQTYANAPQIQMCYQIHPSIVDMSPNGAVAEVDLGAMNSTNRDSPNYWLAGGMALGGKANQPRSVYLANSFESESNITVGFFRYQAWFVVPTSGTGGMRVLNVTPILEDVRLTLLTPPRRLYSEEISQ